MSESSVCPKCSHPREEGAVECPMCGVIYAKYRQRSAAGQEGTYGAGFAPPPPIEPGGAGGGMFNPYAPPESDLSGPTVTDPGATNGVWRRGKLLVMGRDASLPHRCVRCNQPAQRRLSKKLSWHRPLVYLTLLLHVVIYLIVALSVRKKATVEIPLCSEHDNRRRVSLWIAVALLLVAVGASIIGMAEGQPELFAIGTVAFLVCLVVAAAVSNPVIPKRIDDEYVWLKKVSPEYLSNLPEAPAHLMI